MTMIAAEQSFEHDTYEDCDVVVIGGGPGGAAAATYLAKAGLDVVLLEKERHPRFHVGESLLPHSLPILDELGVLTQVREIGVLKPGAEFISEDGTRNAVFDFGRALTAGPDHAYQVRRAEFDKILFERARSVGARAIEGATASIVSCDEAGAVVMAHTVDGGELCFRADFMIDASGRSTVSAKMHGGCRPNRRASSAAVFRHFTGVPRANGRQGGNIRIYFTDSGWMWQIPLLNGITSIGLIVPGDDLAQRNGTIEEFFWTRSAANPQMAQALANAQPAGPISAAGNFSYCTPRSFGPGFIRVGDAYGFIDPIFSSGIQLALESARDGAQAILEIRKHRASRERILAAYDKKIRRRASYLSWFIYRIHDPVFRKMLLNPKNIFGVERAVISLLAGDFRPNWRIRMRILLFKAFRYFGELAS